MRIENSYQIVGQMPDFTQEQLKAEPAFNGVIARATGAVARAFIDRMPADMRTPRTFLQVRVQYMKVGWCWAGDVYHLDMAGERADGNADISKMDLSGEHTVLGSVGSISQTRVIVGPLDLPDIPLGQPQDRLWDNLIRERVARGMLEEHEIPDRAMCRLGNTFHSASLAVKSGIRVFLRARPITTESSDHMGPWYPQCNMFLPLMGTQTNAAALLAAPYFARRTLEF